MVCVAGAAQPAVPSTQAAFVALTAPGCSQQRGSEQHRSPAGLGMGWMGHLAVPEPQPGKAFRKKSRGCTGRSWSDSMNSACMP